MASSGREAGTVAIGYLELTTISRADGRTLAAVLAYRAGLALDDWRQIGVRQDYGNKLVLATTTNVGQISIDAPAMLVAWEEAERRERRADSRLARELIVALPDELTTEQAISLANGYAARIAETYGTLVTCCIHEAEAGSAAGRHAHIVIATRTASVTNGEVTLGAKMRKWDRGDLSAGIVEDLRSVWGEFANEALSRAGVDAAIDMRSYARRGSQKIGLVRLSRSDYERERAGIRTRGGDINSSIKAHNRIIDRIEKLERAIVRERSIQTAAIQVSPGAADAAANRGSQETEESAKVLVGRDPHKEPEQFGRPDDGRVVREAATSDGDKLNSPEAEDIVADPVMLPDREADLVFAGPAKHRALRTDSYAQSSTHEIVAEPTTSGVEAEFPTRQSAEETDAARNAKVSLALRLIALRAQEDTISQPNGRAGEETGRAPNLPAKTSEPPTVMKPSMGRIEIQSVSRQRTGITSTRNTAEPDRSVKLLEETSTPRAAATAVLQANNERHDRGMREYAATPRTREDAACSDILAKGNEYRATPPPRVAGESAAPCAPATSAAGLRRPSGLEQDPSRPRAAAQRGDAGPPNKKPLMVGAVDRGPPSAAVDAERRPHGGGARPSPPPAAGVAGGGAYRDAAPNGRRDGRSSIATDTARDRGTAAVTVSSPGDTFPSPLSHATSGSGPAEVRQATAPTNAVIDQAPQQSSVMRPKLSSEAIALIDGMATLKNATQMRAFITLYVVVSNRGKPTMAELAAVKNFELVRKLCTASRAALQEIGVFVAKVHKGLKDMSRGTGKTNNSHEL
jgi:hypothetical protein